MPHLHTASIVACVGVGSRYEGPSERGISHLLEHMVFRGSAAHPSTYELNREIEALGGTLDAGTAADHTAYSISLPPVHVPRCLELLAGMLGAPVLGGIEIERRVIREELLETLDEDDQEIDADDLVRAALLGDHALAQSILGTLQSLDSIDEAAVRAWHARHYVGQNLSVAIAGAIEAEGTLEACTRSFSALPAGERSRPRAFETYERGPRFGYVDSSGSQAEVRIAVPAVPEGHPLRAASELVGRVLDDGLSTRLFQRVVEQEGLAYEVFATQEAFLDAGLFIMGAAVEPAKTPQMLRVLLELLSGLREGPTHDELERARARSLYDLEACLDGPEALAALYAENALFGLDLGLGQLARDAREVSLEDAREVARMLSSGEHLQAITVGTLERATERDARALISQFR